VNRPLEELFDELTRPARPLGPTDWPEPGQLRRRAEHRRTVRRASIASSVAVVAVVAIAVPATLANRGSGRITPATHDTTNPGGTHKAAPAKSGHPAVTATPTARSTIGAPLAAGAKPPTGGRATFGQVSLVVPDGWSLNRLAGPSPYDGGKSFSNEACIAPPQTPATRSFDGCSGLEIFYDGFLPAQGAQAYNGNRETSAAWAHGPDVPSCPSTGTTAGAAAVLPLQGPSDWAYQLVGTVKKAVYNDWRVSCSDGTSFHPQAWYLPKEQIVFWSYVSNPTAQAILATAVIG
jgi:hypothetical protein